MSSALRPAAAKADVAIPNPKLRTDVKRTRTEKQLQRMKQLQGKRHERRGATA